MIQFKRLLITAEARNAMVLPIKMNHVPPKMPSKALKSLALEGIALATKKIRQVNRLIPAARIDMVLDALGPKCFVIISIHINDSHEIKIPPSNAIQSS